MKKNKGVLFILLPVVITLSLFLVFYSRIQCKPSDAGFWFILALGMSIGVAVTRFAQWSKADKTDSK
jgi:membrane protein CcdC involved in cytochrome C biogenesis